MNGNLQAAIGEVKQAKEHSRTAEELLASYPDILPVFDMLNDILTRLVDGLVDVAEVETKLEKEQG